MPFYIYKARDKFGKLSRGEMTVSSEAMVAQQLKEMGYLPISIAKKVSFGGQGKFGIFRRVKFSELNMFTRQFCTLQRAGLPIISTLKTLKEECLNSFLKDAIEKIMNDVEGGASLSISLEKHPKIFNALYINMIKSGEASGTLDQTLEKLALLGENEEKIRMQIKTATRYPLVIVCTLVTAFIVLTTLIMPRFEKLYASFKVALPLPTQILIGTNYAIRKFWWLMLVILGAFTFLFHRFIMTEKGRFKWDSLKLKIPVFGPLLLKLSASRFSGITGTLMKSGVPILTILELTEGGVGNAVVANTIKDIRKNVLEGKGMSEPMKKSGMFPPIVIQMVKVGEETGRLEDLLTYVAGYYEAQVEYTLNNFATLIEPALILIMGFGVLLMALGVFLPIWNMMSLFRR